MAATKTTIALSGRQPMRVTVAVPALNEEAQILDCVSALLTQSWVGRPMSFSVLVLANNCTDRTVPLLQSRFGDRLDLRIVEVSLPPERSNAGWARRIAMDEAAQGLDRGGDLILSTDADTIVAPDWVARTLAYFARGFDAVAGIARIRSSEWRHLTTTQRRRLALLMKYKTLIAYLKHERSGPDDPWPNHGYEGGASIALTRAMFETIGGCPALPSGEDRALFDAVRRAGGRVRHALDVKVYTSGRRVGRAVGGTADTIRDWCGQPSDRPIHETWRINAELGHVPKTAECLLSFDDLPDEIALAQALVRASRETLTFAMTA